jgi:outer membrane lipoprotein-sorting protein
MRKEPFDPDRLLDGIVDHLRQQPVPPLPEHVFPESVKSPPRTKQHPFAAMRRLMMQRPVQISAAIVFVVAGALILHMVPLGDVATVAMADVVEALNTKKSIMFHVFDYHGDDDPFVTKVMYLGMDRFRTETSGGDVRIVNIKEAKMMYVSHDKRTALIESFEESRELSAQMLDLITILRNIQDKATRRFGERVMKNALHGSETKVIDFAVPLDGREFTLTVDTETKLPIRMEFATVKLAGTNKSFREVYTDFVFDAVLDESLFAINPPADYAVERRVLPKPDSKRGDASLVVLRRLASGRSSLARRKKKFSKPSASRIGRKPVTLSCRYKRLRIKKQSGPPPRSCIMGRAVSL